RCGWLDLCVLRKAVRANGLGYLALTHLDVLDGFDEIPLCVAYEIDGRRVDIFPSAPWEIERAVPVYEMLPGWKTPTSPYRRFEDLPVNAQGYLNRVSDLCGVPLCMITVGNERDQTIVMRETVSV
ncbi:MAG TPA: adenylosuccinate synthetase, partial [Armatimonadota bacterium]